MSVGISVSRVNISVNMCVFLRVFRSIFISVENS